MFDRLTKLEKGKISHRISEINKRHKSAERMSSVHITTENTDWIVPSEKDASVRYIVKLFDKTCDCKLRCSSCEVCKYIHVRGSLSENALQTSLRHLTSALMSLKAIEKISESHYTLPQ